MVNGPAQEVVPLTSRMAARNRTKRAEGPRFEAEGLEEIDTFATNAAHRNEVKDETDKLISRTMQTGSNWTKELTKKTGKADDDECELCGGKRDQRSHMALQKIGDQTEASGLGDCGGGPGGLHPSNAYGCGLCSHCGPAKNFIGKFVQRYVVQKEENEIWVCGRSEAQ